MMTAEARQGGVLAQLTPPVRRILAHSLIFGLALSIADLLFNFYLVSLGYDAGVAGLLSTVVRGAGMLFGIPIGLLIDRIGPQRALIAGMLGYCLGWGLLLSSSELGVMIAAQFLIGATYLLAGTAVVPLLSQVVPSTQRASVFGLNASAALIIGLVGSAFGGLLPAFTAGLIDVGPQDTAAYRMALVSVVVLSVLAIVPLLAQLPVAQANLTTADEASEMRLPLRRLLRFTLSSLTLGIAGGMLLPFQNLFFRQQFGMSDAAVGVVLAWAALGMGFGALLGAPISARLGLRRSAALLRFGTVPAMLLMLVPAMFPAAAGLFFRGLFVAASFPMNDALIMQLTPTRQRGMALSLMSLSWSGGWAVAAVLSGWMQLNWGFAPVIWITVVTYVLSSLAIITMPENRE
jgi:MFS family permease